MHVDNRHADYLSKVMERAHAVMQPAEKFNDGPSDSGIEYDAETKSFLTEVSIIITVYYAPLLTQL